ncbi:homoisocitrate dehydrogenase [Marasmius tenuissimus]|uniref:Homoisocitrate dehydrogenase n=1 Tax=Marasmius tenuissimus TaxID=585030 RepID=A0ABR3AC37_9AGAR
MATSARKSLTIGLIPADGIGREVLPAARTALEAVGSDIPPLKFVDLLAGFELFTRTGTALPDETVESLQNECDCALFGSVSSPSRKVAGYSSPIVGLRKKLDLYANIRPVLSVAPTPDEPAKVDMIVVRENTECLVSRAIPNPATLIYTGFLSSSILSKKSKKSQKRAKKLGQRVSLQNMLHHESAAWHSNSPFNVLAKWHLTIIHKSNVLSVTDGLFRESVRAVHAKEPKYQDISVAEQLVDSAVYRLFREPEIYDVMVAPNLYGDILSDAAAALVGSLGVVPSVNSGDNFVMGEPVHGSAPDIVGQNIANPIASIRSAALMLRHLGYAKGADRIDAAVDSVIREGTLLTPDLGGKSKTSEVVDAIVKRI